jgi:hypothetical protein
VAWSPRRACDALCPVRLPTHCVSIDRVSIRRGPWLNVRSLPRIVCGVRKEEFHTLTVAVWSSMAISQIRERSFSRSFDPSQCSRTRLFRSSVVGSFPDHANFLVPDFKMATESITTRRPRPCGVRSGERCRIRAHHLRVSVAGLFFFSARMSGSSLTTAEPVDIMMNSRGSSCWNTVYTS